jgi:hypothetical protein
MKLSSPWGALHRTTARCPLQTQNRTSFSAVVMRAACQMRTFALSSTRGVANSALSHSHDYVCLNFGGNLAPSVSIRNHRGGIVRRSF